MNRSFLLILIPAALAAVLYLIVSAHLKVHLSPFPFLGAAVVFLAAVWLVKRYQKTHRRR
jgi:hypothetical protein